MAGLGGIPSSPPFSDETVDKVTALLNSGEVDVDQVSSYFSVPVPAIIQALTGISRDAYTNDSYTDKSVDSVMRMINSGVASVADVADYFSADPSIVESYLTDVELYTAEDLANVQQGIAVSSAAARNIDPDGDYTEEEINIVADSINNGLLSAAQAAQQFNVTEAEVLDNMERILTPNERASVSTGKYTDNGDGTYSDAVGNVFNEVNGQLTVDQALTGEQLIARDGPAVAAANAAAAKAAADKAAADAAAIAASNATQAEKDAAAAAAQAAANKAAAAAQKVIVDAANAKAAAAAAAAANTASVGTNAAAGNLLTLDTDADAIQAGLLGSETALKTGATNAIAALDALNASGRSDLSTQNAAGLASVEAQKAIAEQAIRSGTTTGLNSYNTAATAARKSLQDEYADALAETKAQSVIAREDITGAETRGLTELDAGLLTARNDITGEFGRAEEMFDPYALGGQAALQKQLALSGALGQEAFDAAYQESPQMAFLREQGMRANLAGAGATGGLGGGNVQKELARFGQGLASQGLQQQIANLGGLSSQGLNAAGSAANIATSGGTNLANLGIARGQAGLQSAMTSGGNLANIASGLGAQQLQTGTNLGGNLADMRMAQGQAQLGAYTGQGSNLANLATGLGAQQLNTRSNLGSQLSGYNLSTGLPAASTISNLSTNLAAGRTRVGEQEAADETRRALGFADIYANQSARISNDIDNQRILLMNQVNSGAITQAQAQTAYATALATAQGNIGSALTGVQQAPIAAPNFSQGVGNALTAAGTGYDMFDPKIKRLSDFGP